MAWELARRVGAALASLWAGARGGSLRPAVIMRCGWVLEAHFSFMSEELHFPLLLLPLKAEEKALLSWPPGLALGAPWPFCHQLRFPSCPGLLSLVPRSGPP